MCDNHKAVIIPMSRLAVTLQPYKLDALLSDQDIPFDKAHIQK